MVASGWRFPSLSSSVHFCSIHHYLSVFILVFCVLHLLSFSCPSASEFLSVRPFPLFSPCLPLNLRLLWYSLSMSFLSSVSSPFIVSCNMSKATLPLPRLMHNTRHAPTLRLKPFHLRQFSQPLNEASSPPHTPTQKPLSQTLNPLD